MDSYSVTLPRTVFSGVNALDNLHKIAANSRKTAVFTDGSIMKLGLADQVIHILRQAGVETMIISDLPPEPACAQVQRCVDRFSTFGADLIVAVGGGSVMDTAKLASLLASGGYTVSDLLRTPEVVSKSVPTCLIPTTAGTGAEATPNAIVAVPEQELKVGIVNKNMIPDYVILDPVMIRGLPRNIAASTGIDAMAHAIECYTSNKANSFSDFFALEAFDLIIHNIKAACDDPGAMEEKSRMQLAAFYAGVAIACSGTTAVHALSYPLGGKYHIPHGISNAILLMPVMRFNEPAVRSRLARVYDRVAHSDGGCQSEEEKSQWIIQCMENIVRHLDIPTSLSAFHVSRGDLDKLVEAGMQVTRLLDNNACPVTAQDARNIYLQVLDGGTEEMT